MKNVVGYIRVSTDGQVGEDKFGLEVQQQQITEYCAKNDMNILRWFRDEGESGAKLRPGFDMIVYGEISNPPVEAVIVAKTDRVARNIEVYYYYKMLLRNKNIELISIAEDFGQFGVFSSMLESFTLCVAQMERENIRKRTSAGRYAKAAIGGYAGGRTPMGYRSTKGILHIEPNEAELIRRIFRMKDEEGKTYKAIAAELNAEGIKSRTGRQFATSTIQTIYENKKFYQGFWRYGKNREWIKGQHDPILKD